MERPLPEPVPDVASVAAALGDRSRAAMCAALMDGRAWTAGELARYCGLARSTATEHINLLVEQNLAVETRQGRHRYIRLASDEVARVIENLGAISRGVVRTESSLRAARAKDLMHAGRTCYRHLAGTLGVSLTDQLRRLGALNQTWNPTDRGIELLQSWDIEHPDRLHPSPCMDSTERRYHLGGDLGAAICASLFAHDWIERVNPGGRAVRPTAEGKLALAQYGLQLAH